MKKIIYLSLLVVCVIILGGCNLINKQNQQSTETGHITNNNQNNNQQQGSSFVGKLKDAIALGTAMKCTYRKDDNNFGTTYVKGKNVYSEYVAEDSQGNLIMKDNCIYSWGSRQPDQGVKFCFDPSEFEKMIEEGQEFESQTEQSGPPPDIDYNCSPTVINDSQFNPPANINFMDMQQMMQGLKE